MSQENKDKADAAEARTQQTRGFMQQVRVAARRKYTPEEKVRIVLEGFRREATVNELCRREGIKPGAYYAWTKDFIEAGKERLTRDTVRDATRQEINELKRESAELKQIVADLSLDVYRLKKTGTKILSWLRWKNSSGASGRPSWHWEYRKAAITGGAGGNPIRETGEDRGTGSLPKKKTRYWQWPENIPSSVAGNSQHGSLIIKALPCPNQRCIAF
jgi:transposase